MDRNSSQERSFPTTFPVTCHTDYVGQGSTFVAIKGFKTDGVLFIPRALERGATRIIVARDAIIPDDIQALLKHKKITPWPVDDTRQELVRLSALAAGEPARLLRIIAITGTKGKTTTSFLLKHILSHAGVRTALISSAGNYIDGEYFPTSLTTPQADYIHQFLALCVARKVTHVILEVAAQAMTMHRVDGIVFDSVIFTNFGLEHLEFYDSMGSYFAAKCHLLARSRRRGAAYINADDAWCAALPGLCEGVVTFGLNKHADSQMQNVDARRLSFDLVRDSTRSFICEALTGKFNVYNVAGGATVALDYGIASEDIADALRTFPGVPGRGERHALSNGAVGIIDYAHNPLSYQALLPELKTLTDHLIVVFGAGGERDASRRPLMGAIAAQYADVVVITTDNARSEDPQRIANDIYAGIPETERGKVIIELDRERAIKKAFACSRASSMIALLGKGPDCYQIIGAHKTPFYESEILKAL